MSIITVLCYALVVVVALLLIGLIMIQPSKSGDMGAAFGGIGEAFGGKAGSHLTKTTVILTAIFFIVTLALAAFIGRGMGSEKASAEFESELSKPADSAAAKPSGDAAAEAAPAAGDAGAKR